MALRFYRNATAGAKDGILVSNGDDTAPIIFDGMYPGASVVSKTLSNIAIRADAGEVWRYVYVTFKGANSGKFKFGGLYSSASNQANLLGNERNFLLKRVGDTNILISVITEASPSDAGSPDTSVDIVAWGVRTS